MTQEKITKLEQYLDSQKLNVVHWQLNEKTKIRSLGVADTAGLNQILGICEIIEVAVDKVMIGSKFDELRDEPMFLLCWKEV